MLLLDASLELGPKVAMAAAIVVGVVMCFFGGRLFRVALCLAGFAAGAALAAYVAWRVTAPVEQIRAAATYPEIVLAMARAENLTVLMVWGLAGGVAGAVLSLLLHWVGVFLLGVWLGAMLANTTMTRVPTDYYLIVMAVLGLAGGMAALLMRRHIIIISTAFNGAFALMFAVYALLKELPPHQALDSLRAFGGDAMVVLGCTALLGVVGTYVQLAISPKPKPEKK